MFFITFSSLWSFSFFFFMTYTILVASLVSYALPIMNSPLKYTSSKNKSEFSFINGADFLWVCLTPIACLLITVLFWVSPSTSAWFGHVVVTNFQVKMTFLVLLNFVIVMLVMSSSMYFTSREIYDYISTTLNFLYWIILLFYSNTIFTSIFIIEVLSALIFLLLITSTFSSAFFYRNLNLSFGHIFQQSTPYSYLQSVLYFFWVSLISSLNPLLFFLFFYFKIFTFDWYLMEHIFIYFTSSASLKEVFTLGMTWFVLVFCIFLKCGIAPLYIWKPTFFKGIPYYTVFFYICFFYLFLFLFIIHLMTSYFSEIFYFYSAITLVFVATGLVTLLFIICESYYLKAFLAISSILNSLFVILALSGAHEVDIILSL